MDWYFGEGMETNSACEKVKQLFNSPSTFSLFIWETRLGKDRFQIEPLTLIQNITENRLRHVRGPVQFTESIT